MSKNVLQKNIGYLVDQLPQATAFFNKELRLKYASNKWAADFNFDKHAIFNKTIHQLFGKGRKNWENALKECLSGALTPTIVQRYFDQGQNEKWFEWNFRPWYDEQENIVGIIINTIDVTKSLENEHEFDKVKLLLAQQSELANIGTWNYCAINDELTWCETTSRIHEVPDDFTVIPDSAINFYKQGINRNTIARVLETAMKSGQPWSEKLQLITHKGNEKWVISSGKPVFKNEKFVGLIGTCQDIDDQIREQSKSVEKEKLLRTLIDNLPQHIFIKDLESRKILSNLAEVRFFGFQEESEILGKTDFDLFDKRTALESREEDLSIMKSLKPILNREELNTNKAGDQFNWLISKLPLVDENGEIYGIVGIANDMTGIRKKEKELTDLINVTSEQNKKLINFAHIVSHNLRSHSANFSMLLDFLINEKNDEERRNIITMLVTASDNLLETLENLNEVVSINTNTSLDKTPMVLREAAIKVSQNLSAFLQNNNARIINRISDKIIIPVIPAYLDSILMNCITNGIKYKEPSRDPIIELRAMKVKNYTVLSISDNGLGIDLDQYGDKLFGMYKTFHNNPDARGIGLYITKSQIEAMNGKITVTSEVGKGTTFNIYFNEDN